MTHCSAPVGVPFSQSSNRFSHSELTFNPHAHSIHIRVIDGTRTLEATCYFPLPFHNRLSQPLVQSGLFHFHSQSESESESETERSNPKWAESLWRREVVVRETQSHNHSTSKLPASSPVRFSVNGRLRISLPSVCWPRRKCFGRASKLPLPLSVSVSHIIVGCNK